MNTPTRLNEMTALQAMVLMKSGECNPRDLVDASLNQIERLDPLLQAWAYIDRKQVQAAADDIGQKQKRGYWGALSGIPVGIKDIFNTKDMPTQMGSPIWKDFRPGNDARVVHGLRMANAVIAGKTVTAEFAVHAPGPTRNPHDLDYMAGTSSTGSAVAVASFMVPLAIGTQTAGSIIRPASYTGVFGYKPSFGLVPRTAMLKTTDSLDTIGWFARSVDDLGVMLEIMRVHGPDYPISHAKLHDPARHDVVDRAWKVAVVRGPKWHDAEHYAQQALLDFASKLSQETWLQVVETDLPACLQEAHHVHSIIYDKALAYYFREEFKQHTLVSSIMYDTIKHGNEIHMDEYRAALEQQNKISREMDKFFVEHFDIILNLSTGGSALKGLESPDRPDNCLIWTLFGLPAVNVPVFVAPNGLPFGLQVVGRRYDDYKVLAFLRRLRESGLVDDGPNPIPGICMA